MSTYSEVVNVVLPFLSPAEGIVFLKLFSLSNDGRCSIAHERLAVACNISLSTLKRALKSLEGRGLIEQEHVHKAPTTFAVHVKSLDPDPREVELGVKWYDQLQPDDRAAYLAVKRSLRSKDMEEMKQESRERGIDLDRLISTSRFGPDKTKKYEHLIEG